MHQQRKTTIIFFCLLAAISMALAFREAFSATSASEPLILRDMYVIGTEQVSAGGRSAYRAIALYSGPGATVVAMDVTTAAHVPYPLVMGDVNLDGKVDLVDLGLLSGNYGKQIDLSDPNSHPWRSGDLNLSGRVDLADLGLFSANCR